MDIGMRIRAIRKTKDLSQLEVARNAQIAINSLRNYEAGIRQPTIDVLRRIASALDVSLSELFWCGDGPAPEPLQCVATPHGAYIIKDPCAFPSSISTEDLKIALFGTTENVTDSMLEEVRAFAAFILQRENPANEPTQDNP